jgi:spore germination cell wall hydrolase CwlJ-like protein
LIALISSSASCVPVAAALQPVEIAQAAPALTSPDAPAPLLAPRLSAADVPVRAQAFVGRSALDRTRALDCLAQAIYYEARSESEAGRRAVAQVVLNRVRNPAWPASVCGVVYQGPLRVGGGCQFTFTCDGSLMSAPTGEAWAEARRIAGEALAGHTFEPVGLSTHYHANYVFPSWAPRLVAVTQIGAHDFYRIPGALGQAGAFTRAYSGIEPVPHPAAYLPRAALRPGLAALFPAAATARATAAAGPALPDAVISSDSLPASGVREEFRTSGQWRADAPAAITGAH